MKKFIFLTALLFSVTTLNAQFTEVKSSGGTSKLVEQDVIIAGKTFEGFINTKTNYVSIKRVSKDGNPYKQSIGIDTGLKHEGNVVWTKKEKGKDIYFYFTIGKTGWPKKHKLEKN